MIQRKANNPVAFVRTPMQKTIVRRSSVPLILNLIVTNGSILFIFIFVFFLIDLVLSINIIFWTLYFLVIVLFALISSFIMYLKLVKSTYTLIPGYIQKETEGIMDQIPGKVIINEWFIFSSVAKALNMNEFDRTIVIQGLLGRMFNYGNVALEQVDKLQETRDFYLVGVINPTHVASLVQKMIDLEITQAQPSMDDGS